MMHSATQGGNIHETQAGLRNKQRRTSRAAVEQMAGNSCASPHCDHESILGTPELDDEVVTDRNPSKRPGTEDASVASIDLETGKGSRQTEAYGDSTSLYERSHHSANSTHRGVHRSFDDGATL
jgi:hypothetical protein